MNWFYYIIFATFIYGWINFLYKISASKGYSGVEVLNIQSFVVFLLTFIFYMISSGSLMQLKPVLGYAVLNSVFFAAGTVLKVVSLKYIPIKTAMPLGKLNSVFVIIIGLIFFKDRPSLYQSLGIILAIMTVLLIMKSPQSKKVTAKLNFQKKGIMLIILAALCIACSMSVGKLASVKVDKINYMLVSYFFVFMYTTILKKVFIKGKPFHERREVYLLGALIGILNAAGYYLILKAWTTGPLSLVQCIFSLSMVITVILAAIFLHEKLKFRNILSIITALAAALLIKS